MKRIIGVHFFCLLFIMAGASVYAVPYSTDSSTDGPYKIRPLKIQLLVLTMDGFNFGAGLQGDYHFKHAVVEMQWRKALYWSIGKPDPADSKDATTNVAKSFSNIELDGEYYFADYLVNKRYKNILASDVTSYTYNISRAKARRIYAIKGGIFHASGFVATDSAASYNTNYQTTGLAAGLARKRIDKCSDNRHHDGVREIYFQVLTGTTSLEAMNIKPSQGTTPPVPAFHNMGWRLGGQRYGEHLYVGYELGLRPAMVNPDKTKASIPFNYFVINFGFTIYGNEKWK
jgi:hypothetical protein